MQLAYFLRILYIFNGPSLAPPSLVSIVDNNNCSVVYWQKQTICTQKACTISKNHYIYVCFIALRAQSDSQLTRLDQPGIILGPEKQKQRWTMMIFADCPRISKLALHYFWKLLQKAMCKIWQQTMALLFHCFDAMQLVNLVAFMWKKFFCKKML